MIWIGNWSDGGHCFVRYADDGNIYVRTRRAGERVLVSVTHWIETRLKLRVNREKSAVDRAYRRDVLGFTFLPFPGPCTNVNGEFSNFDPYFEDEIGPQAWSR